MSIFSRYQSHPDYFKDKIVIYQTTGFAEISKENKYFFLVDWLIKLYRNLTHPESRISNVVKGFEAEKMETRSPQKIFERGLNFLEVN